MRINLPLRIHTSKNKSFILNLNNYRNAHHRVLSIAKVNYTEAVKNILEDQNIVFRVTQPVTIHYLYFHGSKRKVDVSNPCSVIDKFACDAITSAGIWQDDDSATVKSVTYEFGGVDKLRPRCEMTIKCHSCTRVISICTCDAPF